MGYEYYAPTQTLLNTALVVTCHYALSDRLAFALPIPVARDDPVYLYATCLVVHVDEFHLYNNLVLLVLNGGIFELLHGGIALQGVFWIAGVTSVLAEATNVAVPRRLLGMSGAAYGVLGAYVGHLALNWEETRLRGAFLVSLLLYAALNVVWYTTVEEATYSVAHLAHIAGAVQGVFVGCVAVHNEKAHPFERMVRVIAYACALLGIATTVLRIQPR